TDAHGCAPMRTDAQQSRRQPRTSAPTRRSARLAGRSCGARFGGMAVSEHEHLTDTGDELISFAEAGRRIPKRNGAPRSERTMQDWGARGLLPVVAVSA